jgi:hypothetical protein
MSAYPSCCVECGSTLTSEEFGGWLCFVCEHRMEAEDDYDDEPPTCPHCSGTGIDVWTGFEDCEYCDGMGYRWWE